MSNVYHFADHRRNRLNTNDSLQFDVPLTKGGKVIKRTRPQLSASLCNAIASLAGLGTEVVNG